MSEGTSPTPDPREPTGHTHRSRWPPVAALGAGLLYLGLGLWFVGDGLVPVLLPPALAGVGVVGLVAGLAGWTYQAFLAGPGSVPDGLCTGGMVLFLVSDVATFAAGFVYYAFVRAGAWPPADLPELLGSLVVTYR